MAAHLAVALCLVAGIVLVAALRDVLTGGGSALAALADPRALGLGALWLAGWLVTAAVATAPRARAARIAVPAIFAATLLVLWQCAVTWYAVPPVILPAPTDIARALTTNLGLLWGDFVQTILKGGLSGYLMGVLAAVVVGIAVDRAEVLRRGLLPVASFLAALPIVGTAPILVAWFGFGWESKAAVVVVMVFFPMLVNIVAGLSDTTAMQRDLMRTYGTSYWATLRYLKLPAALPFIFNGLKISTTLALVGAIVAEFFGSPTVGLGFRINQSAGQLALDTVWAAIVVSALAGGAFYALVAGLERALTFWHPSHRKT